MIKTAIKCPNNMVIVFDEKGEQLPAYQGRYEEVKRIILKDALPDAVFSCLHDYKPELKIVRKEEW